MHKPQAPMPVDVADVAVTLTRSKGCGSPNPHAIDADTERHETVARSSSHGSNLGDRFGNVQGAVDALSDTPDVIVVDVSSVYETRPLGGPPDSPEFLNIVVIAETTLEPRTLVERAFAIEDAYGRTRDGDRWGPRTLDVDLIMVATPSLIRKISGCRIRSRTNARSCWCRGTRSTRRRRLRAREPLATCSARRTRRVWSGEMIL